MYQTSLSRSRRVPTLHEVPPESPHDYPARLSELGLGLGECALLVPVTWRMRRLMLAGEFASSCMEEGQKSQV